MESRRKEEEKRDFSLRAKAEKQRALATNVEEASGREPDFVHFLTNV